VETWLTVILALGSAILGSRSTVNTSFPGTCGSLTCLCNREDYGWRMRIRRMLEKGMSPEEIAENLNHKLVRRPHGSSKWCATAVRKAFVS
jgi:hypothetical protein